MDSCVLCIFFFFNDTATTEIYTLSLHDALPIGNALVALQPPRGYGMNPDAIYHTPDLPPTHHYRSEEHTSELQSQSNLVCRLLLEKKKKNTHHCAILRTNYQHHTIFIN